MPVASKRDGTETGQAADGPANGQAGVKFLPTMLLPMEHQEFLKCFWLVHVIAGSAVRLPFAASTVSRVTNKSTAAKAHCQYSRRCVSFFLAASTASGAAAGALIGRPNLLNCSMTIGSVRLSAAVRFTANVSDQPLPFAVYRPGAAGVKTVSTGIAAAPSPGGMTVTPPPGRC